MLEHEDVADDLAAKVDQALRTQTTGGSRPYKVQVLSNQDWTGPRWVAVQNVSLPAGYKQSVWVIWSPTRLVASSVSLPFPGRTKLGRQSVGECFGAYRGGWLYAWGGTALSPDVAAALEHKPWFAGNVKPHG